MIFIQHLCILYQSWIPTDFHSYFTRLLASRCEKASLIRNVSHNEAFQTIRCSLSAGSLCWCWSQSKGASVTFKQRTAHGEPSRPCATKPAVHAATSKSPNYFWCSFAAQAQRRTVQHVRSSICKRLLSQTKPEIMYFLVQLVPHLHWLYYSRSFLQLHAAQCFVP